MRSPSPRRTATRYSSALRPPHRIPRCFASCPYDPAPRHPARGRDGAVAVHLPRESPSAARSVQELINLARKYPGKLNAASGGIGTRLSSELFQIQNQLKLEIIPYQGSGQAALAVMTGEADFVVMETSPVHGQLAAGRLKALAVAGEKRLTAFPSVPTTAEAGFPGYKAGAIFGLYVAAGTPADIVQKLNATINKIISAPAVAGRLQELGAEVESQEQSRIFPAWYRKEMETWKTVVKRANIPESAGGMRRTAIIAWLRKPDCAGAFLIWEIDAQDAFLSKRIPSPPNSSSSRNCSRCRESAWLSNARCGTRIYCGSDTRGAVVRRESRPTIRSGPLQRAIVPFSAGASNDTMARLISPLLTKALGQQVSRRKPAGCGRPDGHRSAGQGGAGRPHPPVPRRRGCARSRSAAHRCPYDPVRDVQPVADLGTSPYVIAIHPQVAGEKRLGAHRSSQERGPASSTALGVGIRLSCPSSCFS